MDRPPGGNADARRHDRGISTGPPRARWVSASPRQPGCARGAVGGGDSRRAHAWDADRARTSGSRTQEERPLARHWSAFRAVPRAAWICALVTCLRTRRARSSSPPFRFLTNPITREYVKQLAETGTLPSSSAEIFSTEETLALVGFHYPQIRLPTATRAIFSAAEQSSLEKELQALRRLPKREARMLGSPRQSRPLYYALESVPYILASGGALLDRLQLMRLLSTLMAGLTAMFTFLFLRETLPRTRWAWTVGALAVALTPLLGFMSGAVNPDAMLFAVSAALFYCLARAFRRGLTPRSAIATGLVIAVGFLTKLNFAGLASWSHSSHSPSWRCVAREAPVASRCAHRRSRPRSAACRSCCSSSPVRSPLVRRSASWLTRSAPGTARCSPRPTTYGSSISRDCREHHPRADFRASSRQARSGSTAMSGGWLARHLLPQLGLHIGARRRRPDRRVVRPRTAGRSYRPPRACAGAGVCTRSWRWACCCWWAPTPYLAFPSKLAEYGQARYLLPLLPLLGAVLALAARGAGRRWGPATGTLIVVLFLAHDIFSQLQVVTAAAARCRPAGAGRARLRQTATHMQLGPAAYAASPMGTWLGLPLPVAASVRRPRLLPPAGSCRRVRTAVLWPAGAGTARSRSTIGSTRNGISPQPWTPGAANELLTSEFLTKLTMLYSPVARLPASPFIGLLGFGGLVVPVVSLSVIGCALEPT